MEDHMRRLTLALLAGSLLIGLVAAPVSARRAGPSIVDTAIAVNAATGEFSTLIAALQAADLVGALDGNRQFTVFAPTDAAFAALGLNADNIGTLDDTALTNVVAADSLRMLNGQRADVEVDGSSVTIDGAPIVDVDIRTSNGIIHVVGGVLLP
jgi:transforming growth factor-beta-induced protein